MSATQFLTTPDGTEMAVLTRARYDELIEAEEELRDIVAAEAGTRSLAEDGGIPFDVERKIAMGQSGVYAWRAQRGLTQADLAEKVGVSQAAIAKIEARPGSGRDATLRKIAEALGAPLWTLEGPEPQTPAEKLGRAVDRLASDDERRLRKG